MRSLAATDVGQGFALGLRASTRDAASIASLPDDTPCDDGNACNAGDHCESGTCTPASGLDCEDDNACTANDCDGLSSCENSPLAAGSPCFDGNACSTNDTCNGAGSCQGGPALDCDDLDECTEDGCDAANGCTRRWTATASALWRAPAAGRACRPPASSSETAT